MLRRFYTVMVVPHEGGSLTRLNVSQNFVVSMTAIFMFCFVSSAFLAHFFLNGVHQVDGSEQFRVDAERLTLENAQVESGLYRTVLKLEELTARLEELSTLNGWVGEDYQTFDAGGLSFDSEDAGESPLDSDWRGMARAAQDKAEFWSDVLEQQICDRSSFLRSLPTVWPVHGRLTSGYQWRRDPITGKRQFHAGIDISAPRGTPVLASGDGVIAEAGRHGAYGNCVRIDHGNGVETLYAHLSRVHVRLGDPVSRADVIGEVGSTGRSTGAHLHMEITEEGKRVNPLRHYLSSRPGKGSDKGA